MFYLVEECGKTPNGILRYTICSTEEQFNDAIDNSPMTFADGYEFDTKEELLDWLKENATIPVRE